MVPALVNLPRVRIRATLRLRADRSARNIHPTEEKTAGHWEPAGAPTRSTGPAERDASHERKMAPNAAAAQPVLE